jgi:simple sugar transport system permease protein
LWFLTLQGATPLVLVALGLYLSMRAGILNLGAEGMMLFACFGAILVEAKMGGGALLGTLGGVGTGVLVSAVFALTVVRLRADSLVVGIGLNFLAAGATATAASAVYGVAGTISTPDLRPLPSWPVPVIKSIPWIGDVLSGQTPVTYLSWVLALAIAWWLANTRAGLTIRVSGSRPEVAEAIGRPVEQTQWRTLLAGGALIGLGGAQLALAAAAQFSPDMTAGRGFIALAIILVAGVRAWLLLPLAIVFALFDALGLDLQSLGLPSELSAVLPYLAIIVLLLVPESLERFGRGRNGLKSHRGHRARLMKDARYG